MFGEGERNREEEQRGEDEAHVGRVDEKEMPKWHVMQRPLRLVGKEGEGKLVLVYVLWSQGDEQYQNEAEISRHVFFLAFWGRHRRIGQEMA